MKRMLLGRQQELLLKQWNEKNQMAIDQSKQGLSKPLDDQVVLERMRAKLAEKGIAD